MVQHLNRSTFYAATVGKGKHGHIAKPDCFTGVRPFVEDLA